MVHPTPRRVKPGTAQAVTVGQKEKYNAAKLAEHQRDHSLYIAYAPAENPKIAVALIVENAGFGAAAAAPIARRVFDYWLLDQYPSEEDMAAVRKGQVGRPIGTPRSGQAMMARYERMALPGVGAARVLENLSGGDVGRAASAGAGRACGGPSRKLRTEALRERWRPQRR